MIIIASSAREPRTVFATLKRTLSVAQSRDAHVQCTALPSEIHTYIQYIHTYTHTNVHTYILCKNWRCVAVTQFVAPKLPASSAPKGPRAAAGNLLTEPRPLAVQKPVPEASNELAAPKPLAVAKHKARSGT